MNVKIGWHMALIINSVLWTAFTAFAIIVTDGKPLDILLYTIFWLYGILIIWWGSQEPEITAHPPSKEKIHNMNILYVAVYRRWSIGLPLQRVMKSAVP